MTDNADKRRGDPDPRDGWARDWGLQARDAQMEDKAGNTAREGGALRDGGARDDEPRAEFAASLGHTIKVFRTDRGQSRRDLAQAAGISYSYVTEIENGRKPPSSPVLLRIAEALDVTPSELLADAESRAEASSRVGARLDQDADELSTTRRRWFHAAASAGPLDPLYGRDPLSPTARRLRAQSRLNEEVEWRAPAGLDAATPAGEPKAPPAPRPDAPHATSTAPQPRVAPPPGETSPSPDIEQAAAEVAALMRRLPPEDVERVLDMVRRLAR